MHYCHHLDWSGTAGMCNLLSSFVCVVLKLLQLIQICLNSLFFCQIYCLHVLLFLAAVCNEADLETAMVKYRPKVWQ